jgi:hypothetical protein
MGFDFVPLRTVKDVIDEALAMKHCLRWYGHDLASGTCRLWSLQKGGVRVATLELGMMNEAPFPFVTDIKLENNERAPAGIWLAARAWLKAQGFSHLLDRDEREAPQIDAKAWRAMWRPYWLAKRRFPNWLPIEPSFRAFDDL